ncbi:carboxyltransferase domain-containing protein [Aquitalea palustris]|uniref:Carboxyltransferase domain-containing protein n=1 Tax=Aquitalea palustris TaxID=2480983 RepID=A0A454JE75_9NEIS|nr:carboxyltransferase domain-containing protein [Aquitalea palustris]RMC92773.1 carboxyltransferase domain-containing protein [Aquitalea palustris]
MSIRYTFGGDEFLFAEVSESMSLPACFTSMAITGQLRQLQIPGIMEICPANASFQLRFDPDILPAEQLLQQLQQLEQSLADSPQILDTRLVEIPVWYNDPWTREVGARFRQRHQDPQATDLEYAARVNGFASVEAFIAAHCGAPWFVSMVGFVAGLPFLYQMVERQQQLQVPKYLSPRTATPRQTIGHGGCFACIYSVEGAGGYQMFGITPAPIYDPAQSQPYLADSMVLFRPGDIVRFKPIQQQQYEEAIQAVADGSFQLDIFPVRFSLPEFLANPQAYQQSLPGTHHAH